MEGTVELPQSKIEKMEQETNSELSDVTEESVKTFGVFMASIAANLAAVCAGTGLGWTSPTLPKLKIIYANPEIKDSPLSNPIDIDQESWISSIMAIGAAITPFIAGPLADKIGRKKVILSSAAFFILAYTLMLFAFEVWIMLLARLIKGFGVGFVMSVVPMYVGEISTDDVRGAVGCLMSLFMGIGLYSNLCIGPFVSYYALQYFCLSLPIVFVIVFAFMPESPYHCIAQKNRAEASKSLQFLRGQSSDAVEKELSGIEKMVQESMAQKGTIVDLIKNPASRRALFVCLGLITFQQVSGINAVLFNSQSIFESAHMGVDGAVAAIIVTSIQLLTAAMTPFIADTFGRKTILLSSAAFMGVGLMSLGCFFYVKLEVGHIHAIDWLPIPSLIMYTVMYVIGFGPVPWTVLSEMFAPNVKRLAASMVASLCWIAGFFVALIYPSLEAWGVYYAFWIFGFLSFPLAFVFTLVFVMETRKLSLQEIQNRLNKK